MQKPFGVMVRLSNGRFRHRLRMKILTKFLPSRAAFFRSYLCRSCELYLIDYSETLTRAEADEAAKAMIEQNS